MCASQLVWRPDRARSSLNGSSFTRLDARETFTPRLTFLCCLPPAAEAVSTTRRLTSETTTQDLLCDVLLVGSMPGGRLAEARGATRADLPAEAAISCGGGRRALEPLRRLIGNIEFRRDPTQGRVYTRSDTQCSGSPTDLQQAVMGGTTLGDTKSKPHVIDQEKRPNIMLRDIKPHDEAASRKCDVLLKQALRKGFLPPRRIYEDALHFRKAGPLHPLSMNIRQILAVHDPRKRLRRVRVQRTGPGLPPLRGEASKPPALLPATTRRHVLRWDDLMTTAKTVIGSVRAVR